MTDGHQNFWQKVFSDAAIGKAFSIVANIILVAAAFLGIVIYVTQKSATLEAEFIPSKIAFAEVVNNNEQGMRIHFGEALQRALNLPTRFEKIIVAETNTKLSLDDLAQALAADAAKQAGPLSRLQVPPDGQMQILVTNSGDLPAKKVRVSVPDAVLYVMKKKDVFGIVPHSKEGIELGQISQGKSVEVFAFTHHGLSYGSNYCTFSCDLAVTYEDGVGTVSVRVPRTLFETLTAQGFWVTSVVIGIGTLGLVIFISLILHEMVRIFRSVVGNQSVPPPSAGPS